MKSSFEIYYFIFYYFTKLYLRFQKVGFSFNIVSNQIFKVRHLLVFAVFILVVAYEISNTSLYWIIILFKVLKSIILLLSCSNSSPSGEEDNIKGTYLGTI